MRLILSFSYFLLLYSLQNVKCIQLSMDNDDEGLSPNDLCGSEYVQLQDRRCRCITCKPGHYAHTCNTGDPDTSYCDVCPKGEFRPDVSVLGNKDYCSKWRKCNLSNMKVSSHGSATEDVKCTCEEGYSLVHGGSACIYTPVIHDKPTTVRVNATTAVAKSEDGASFSAGAIIIPLVSVSIIAFFILLLWLLWQRRKKQQGECKKSHLNHHHEQTSLLECNISNITNPELNTQVLNICCTEMEQKIGKDWKILGRHLLGDRLDYALEGTRDSKIEEKVAEIMKTWKQTLGHSADTRSLLEALKIIKRRDIIDHLNNVICNSPDFDQHFSMHRTEDTQV